MRKLGMTVVSVLAVAGLAACGGAAKESGGSGASGGAPAASLYDRLGGKDAITKVVKDFVEQRVAKDDRINVFFKNADIPGLESKLVDQICEASGGPCKYTGKDMKTAHTGMAIRDADFNAMVDDLKVTLNAFKVPAKEQGELLGALAPMHDDIVGK